MFFFTVFDFFGLFDRLMSVFPPSNLPKKTQYQNVRVFQLVIPIKNIRAQVLNQFLESRNHGSLVINGIVNYGKN